MKMIFKFIVLLFVFVLALFLFFPKKSAYYFLENKLEQNKIVVSDETLTEGLNYLKIADSKIYFEGINIAKVSEVKLSTTLVNTQVQIKDIKILDSFKQHFPSPINEAFINYSVIDFKKAYFKANGVFGSLDGEIDIFNRVVKLKLKASSRMRSSYSRILRMMKSQNGEYTYEYRF